MRAFWENVKLIVEIFAFIIGALAVLIGVPAGLVGLLVVLGLPFGAIIAICFVFYIVVMAAAKTIIDGKSKDEWK